MRIVSLLPAATEALFDMGASPLLVGRSHACTYPAAAIDLPVVTIPTDPPAGADLLDAALNTVGLHGPFEFDIAALEALEPDLIIAQTACPACTIDETTVATIGTDMGAGVVRFDPSRLDDVMEEIEYLGKAVDRRRDALALVSHMQRRLAAIERLVAGLSRPKVALLEWTNPVYAPGRWVPDIVAAAGGLPVIGEPGGRTVPTSLAAVADAAPDVVVVAGCGLDLAANHDRYVELAASPGWEAVAGHQPRILAIDAGALLTTPGPRVADAAEALAWALHAPHPDLRPAHGNVAELRNGSWIDLGGQPTTSF